MRILTLAALAAAVAVTPALADPLPSWADTEAKTRIVDFVERVTDPASPDYVTPPARIAAFDNDRTLWAEKPVYFQLLYALDRLREQAAADPSILTSDVLKAAAEGDMEGMMAGGMEGLLEVLAVSHAGVTVDAFQADVADWLATATHPETGKPYDEMLYQPMLELLRYLRDEGFATWIVSGGGIHFIRAFAAEAYGIPPHQVVGSGTPVTWDAERGAVMKEPGIAFVDDKGGKPVGIDAHIGALPIFVAGNSDGDFAMLDYATSADGPRFGMILHHTDGTREWAYDRDSHVGKLVRGLEEGPQRGWLIVDMAKDWDAVFPE